MSDTLYEKSNTGDNGWAGYFAANWEGQTFTPSITHTITSVKLLIYRDLTPGTITVSVRATTGGVPTGADLCSGTINGDTITTDTAGAWYEFTFGAGTLLQASTQYALIFRAVGIDGFARHRISNPGTYTGGGEVVSSDSGANWSLDNTFDYQFEEYGVPIAGEVKGQLFIYGTTLHYVGNDGVEYAIQGTMA